MTYRGRVKNGLVVLEPGARFPDGAEVRVEEVAPQNALSVLTGPSDEEFARIWSELEQDMVAVGHVDDSREAIYSRMPGE